MNIKINKFLPKYKKRWVKESSLTPIQNEEGGIYLVFKNNNPEIHRNELTIKYLSQYQDPQFEGVYFFELFKYLKKLKAYDEAPRTYRVMYALNMKDLKSEIKKHLIKSFNKKINVKTARMEYLLGYSNLLNYCFSDLIRYRGTEISLVIQKKIGYKYYQNIIYT